MAIFLISTTSTSRLPIKASIFVSTGIVKEKKNIAAGYLDGERASVIDATWYDQLSSYRFSF